MPKSTNKQPDHVTTAAGSPTKPPKRPAPHKPAKRSPAVIRADEVYSWAELRPRLGWAEHSGRQARNGNNRPKPLPPEKTHSAPISTNS
jgi:hypothetical protein